MGSRVGVWVMQGGGGVMGATGGGGECGWVCLREGVLVSLSAVCGSRVWGWGCLKGGGEREEGGGQ